MRPGTSRSLADDQALLLITTRAIPCLLFESFNVTTDYDGEQSSNRDLILLPSSKSCKRNHEYSEPFDQYQPQQYCHFCYRCLSET